MNNSRLIVAACLVCTCSILAFAGRQAPAASSSVLVTNSTSQCVPVSIYHAVPQSVTQTGNWNMIKNGDRAPFFHTETIFANQAQSFVSGNFFVPAGRRIIIDQMSFYTNALNPGDGFNLVEMFSESNTDTHGMMWLPLSATSDPATTVGNAVTQFDAEPGDTVTLQFSRVSSTTSATVAYSVSGHYVPVY